MENQLLTFAGTEGSEKSKSEIDDEEKTQTKEMITDEIMTEETQTEDPSPAIRVLIKTSDYKSYYHDQIVLSGNCLLRFNDSLYESQIGEEITIKSDSGWFCENQIHIEPEDPGCGIQIRNLKRASGIPVYEGSFDIYRTENGLLLVNELNLETYLRYVVPSEMPASYSEEALKAQAVCARTYAWRQILNEDLSKYHAHVDDSVSYQVYHNLDPQSSTDEAIQATESEIMTCNGEPITAYFFSTSCGFTSTDEVWSGKSGETYLKSVSVGSNEKEVTASEEAFSAFLQTRNPESLEADDAWYRWNVILPENEIEQRMSDQAIGEITSMNVKKRSSGGAVEQLEITGTDGTAVIENEYRIRQLLSVKGYTVSKNDGSTTTDMNLLPSAYFTVSPLEEEGKITAFCFSGGGYGHGVGMSQNGANHLALLGYHYHEILNYFYQNIEITKWNGACSG
ncbi:MAG: SpoIID/LytB domain-containing protein [Fusicatenibacter sp.]|nr:SpoIID/LytB domain-containing protein [Lachnospiraceae bacterium]MDY2937457.1 SpoIID/LytB domain-containing protein [Fusicatenibacter sp.]